jgi:tetratricopeptide (TPR) repeat protein
VLFVDMFGYDLDPSRCLSPGQALEGFLRAVGVPGEHIPSSIQDRSRLLRSVLAAYVAKRRRVLVVVDNVRTAEQARPLLPSDGTCAAIVTSRDSLANLDARLLKLRALPIGQAVDLLDAALRLRDPGDARVLGSPNDAQHLAKLCGGLPLALQIVAALLAANSGKPLAAMAAELDDAASRLEEMTFAEQAVKTVFDTSYHRLPEAQARLFRLLSLNPGPDISTAATAALTSQPKAEVRRGLDALGRANLIEPAGEYGRWRMHDLLRIHSGKHGTNEAETDLRDHALVRLLDYYLTTTRAADAHLDPLVANASGLGFLTRKQALGWLDTEYLNLTAAAHTAAATSRHAIARDLPQAMRHFLDWRRHFNDWIALSYTALGAARSLGDRHGEGVALNDLCVALRRVRNFEDAIGACQEAADIFRETGNRHGEADAINNLGIALREMRRFKEAISACRKAAQIYRETGDHHGEADALDDLGVALRRIGRLEDAITAHRNAARLYRETGDRHGECDARRNLGVALREVGRFEEAITAHREDLEICRELGDRHGEAMTLNRLGIALRQGQRFEEAITTCQEAADIYRETRDHHGEADALDDLGVALRRLGRLEDAITAHQRAAQIYRETDRHGEADAISNLGIALREMRRFKEAISACRKAAQIYRETGDHHGESIALQNLHKAQQRQSVD